MEMEYIKADLDFWVYAVLAVGGWLFQLYKKQKEKEAKRKGNFLDDEPRQAQQPERNFDEVLKKFSADLKRELRTNEAKEITLNPVPKQEPTVNSLEELKMKYGSSTVMTDADRDPDKRFDHYEIKKEKKNYFADLLDDSENFKKAFVLSEILKRKEY